MDNHWAVEALGQTDQGRARDNNQDALYVDQPSAVLIVSDGMGGQQAGAVASRIVVEALPRQIADGRMMGQLADPDGAAEHLRQAMTTLGELILEKGGEYPQLRGMGATVVAGVVVADSLVLAHLGDSRAYLLRDGALELLTKDHTMADLLLDVGAIKRRHYRRHPGQHQLRRYIGMPDCPPPDVAILSLRPGDRILLCTDGLIGMVDDRTIGQVLLEVADREGACLCLIDLANEAGGLDNVTVVVADVPNGEPSDQARATEVVVRRAVGRSLRQPESGEEVLLV